MITWNRNDFNSLVARMRQSHEQETEVLRYSRSDHARLITARDTRGNKVPVNKAAMTDVQYLGHRDPYEDFVRFAQKAGTKIMDRYVVLIKDATTDCVMIGLQYMSTEVGVG